VAAAQRNSTENSHRAHLVIFHAAINMIKLAAWEIRYGTKYSCNPSIDDAIYQQDKVIISKLFIA
jgi:hypothetical protein